MKVFVDANILVSVLNKEYPLFTYSARVLSLADSKQFQIYTSPVCLAIAFYFSEKKSGTVAAKRKIEMLVERLEIAIADKEAVLQSIKNKSVQDFEDGLEYYSALSAECDCLVTQDVGDFHFSNIEVMDAETFLITYKLQQN